MLKDILAHKREELKERKRQHKVADLKAYANEQGAPRGFADAMFSAAGSADAPGVAMIAEIKRASPSRGVLREDFDPLALAKAYAAGGATCLSVLTDQRFFQGAGAMLDVVRRHCMLPALRKDFIIDEYQIHESRAFGADCILLIVAALEDGLMADLFARALEYDMDVLVEAHDEDEVARALALGDELRLVGVNNRNLETFEVSLETTERLAPLIPEDKLTVCESGIHAHADIERMGRAGVRAFLVGESLMRADDPQSALQSLLARD